MYNVSVISAYVVVLSGETLYAGWHFMIDLIQRSLVDSNCLGRICWIP